MQTPYEILGVHRQSTEFDIRARYFMLAKQTHPDALGNDYSKVAEFAAIGQAYTILTDPQKRNAMLGLLAMKGETCIACDGEGATHKQISFKSRITTACPHCKGSGYINLAIEEEVLNVTTDAGSQAAPRPRSGKTTLSAVGPTKARRRKMHHY